MSYYHKKPKKPEPFLCDLCPKEDQKAVLTKTIPCDDHEKKAPTSKATIDPDEPDKVLLFTDSLSKWHGACTSASCASFSCLQLCNLDDPEQSQSLINDDTGLPLCGVKVFLNGFENGLGVAVVDDKITSPEEFLAAQRFHKLCFCLEAPYDIQILVDPVELGLATSVATEYQVKYQIRLATKAAPVVKDHDGHSDKYSDSHEDYDSCWRGDCSKKYDCGCDKKKCCDNPCGKLVRVPCDECFDLPTGITKLKKVTVPANGQIDVHVDFDLCKKCRSKYLTNAWCLTAFNLNPGDVALTELEFDDRTNASLDDADPNCLSGAPFQSISIGEGAQRVLSKIQQDTAELPDLSDICNYQCLLYTVDGDKAKATLVNGSGDSVDTHVFFVFRSLTKVTKKDVPHAPISDDDSLLAE